MTKFQKIVLGIVAGLVVVLSFSVANLKSQSSNLGSVYNRVVQEFRAGLKAGTSNQFVVSNAGAITTSADITATGTTSITGPMTLGSATNGLKSFEPVVTSAADATLTAAQSGTSFFTTTAGVDWTLPAVATCSGCHFRFTISGNFATTSVTVVSAAGDDIEGSIIVAGAVVDCDAADVLTFVNDGENIGDFVELISNGINWIPTASGALTASKLTCSG